MTNVKSNFSRRAFCQIAAAGAAGITGFWTVPGLFAEELTKTPQQTEGPYYPTRLPLDTDNDLLIINDNITPAVGQVVVLTGRILTPAGSPLRNATIEIWQADNTGAYIHPNSMGYERRDLNFQGYGKFSTDSSGEYLFRTIKPALYTGRTRHIHFKVNATGQPVLTSQLYFQGEPENARDSVFNGIRDARARESVTVALTPMKDSKVGAMAARLDVVVGEAAMSEGGRGGPGRGGPGGRGEGGRGRGPFGL